MPTMAPTEKSHALAAAALTCFVCALAALGALHVLRPDYELAKHMISDYAVGPFRWLMISFFVPWSVGILALVLSLLLRRPVPTAHKVGAICLGIASVGLLVSASYPTDLPGRPDTNDGFVHTISFLVNIVCVLLAVVFLSVGVRWRPDQRSARVVALVLALLVVAAFVVQLLTLRADMPYGLTNRLFVALLFVWFIAAATWLLVEPSTKQSRK